MDVPNRSPRNGMLGTVAYIVQKENIFGLWKGMTPVRHYFNEINQLDQHVNNTLKLSIYNILIIYILLINLQSITRVIPGVGLYFSSLHWLKHTLDLEEPLTALQAISLGVTARSMSGALLIPITVVKTRFEVRIVEKEKKIEMTRLNRVNNKKKLSRMIETREWLNLRKKLID